MTKAELAHYRRRRERILRMARENIRQSIIARTLNMSPQRVNQIIRGK